MAKTKRASEETFNKLHNLVTDEFVARIESGEATTADLKAASDWLSRNDITGIALENTALGKLSKIMPTVDFDAVQKAVKYGS
tara:strand:+ start:94 stop:342 length:249 start_codon:yes stop_codon:yes gene_type:complete